MMNLAPKPNTRLLNVTQAQIEWMCGKQVLTEDATLSLLQRAIKYNEKWKAQNANLTPRDISAFYKGAGITLQRFTHALGPPTPTKEKMKEQKEHIEHAQKRLLYVQDKGHDIFELDESVFSKSTTQHYAWAPKGDPIHWDYKKGKAPDYVAVCGVISARLGKVLMNCQYGSFTAEDIISTLILVK